MNFMKKLVVLVTLLPLLALSQKQMVLTGKIKGLKDGSRVSLVDINTPTDTLGKAVVKSGTFVMKVRLKEVTLTTLGFDNGKRISLFLENTVVNLTGNIEDVKGFVA